MSDGEIVTSYRQALDRKAQIRILAELNDCSTDEIIAILHNRGIEAPKVKRYDPSEVKEAKVPARRNKPNKNRFRTGKWAEDESQTAVNMYEDGYSVEDIARNLRRTSEAVRARIGYLRKNGVEIFGPDRNGRNRKRWTAEEDKIILDMCRDGSGAVEVAEAIGRSACSVKSRIQALRREGVQVAYRGKKRRNDPD